MPGCYQSSPTPPDSSPGHMEMSLLGARGNAAEMGLIPRALGWVQGPLPKAAHILWKPRTGVMPTSGSAPSGMPLPREMLASSPHLWGLNYLINPFPSTCE